MRHLTLLVLFIGTLHAQQRVLFIGNSYTAANNLPTMVATIASSANQSLVCSQQTLGGATFYQHSQSNATYAKLASQNWDYVVLQAQSQEPSFPYSQFSWQTLPYAIELVDSIRSLAPCAQPVFFRTWGRENGDQANCAVFPPLCTYEGMDSMLHRHYSLMADTTDAYLSPVGTVWKHIRDTDSTINLYTSDGSHPSLAGTYAAACTFFTMITRMDPNTITDDQNLNPTVAATIRQAAKDVVFDSLSTWNVGLYDTQAGFTASMSNDTLTYTDTSLFADSVYYDFGDGSFSATPNGIHAYGQDDFFTVTQYAFRCGKVDTTSMLIQSIVIFSVDEVAQPKIDLKELDQFWPANLHSLTLYSLSGKTLWSAQQTKIPELPPSSSAMLILEATWTNGLKTRQRYYHHGY
ncbi:MAG: hypothetical protein P8Q49_04675 [Schleiferiaceae bacterium]|nr:hypothetical protein [Schleiferiaceae bacterium]